MWGAVLAAAGNAPGGAIARSLSQAVAGALNMITQHQLFRVRRQIALPRQVALVMEAHIQERQLRQIPNLL